MIGRRKGRAADIIRLDHHSPWGHLIDRIKGKVTEKDIGIAMIEKIENICAISKFDREEFRRRMAEKEAKEWEEMRLQAKEMQENQARRPLFAKVFK